MSGALADRETRDIDDSVLTYAEIKALSVGDPLLKTRIETSNELERSKIHSRQREQELRKMKNIIEESPNTLDRLRQRKRRLLQDMHLYEKGRESLTKHERHAFGEELLLALRGNSGKSEERFFDVLHGFRIVLPAGMTSEKPFVLVIGKNVNRYEVDMREAKEAGCIQRIEYMLQHFSDRINAVDENISRVKTELSQAKEEVAKGNAYTREVTLLNKRLLDIDQELNRRAEESVA